MDERSKCETRIHQDPRGEHRQQPFLTWPQQLLARYIHEGKRNKSKNELLGLKASAQQKKQSVKLKDNLQNGRRYLQMVYQIKG